MKMTLAGALALIAAPAAAHFGMIIPSDTMIGSEDAREITLRMGFAHPFEPAGMDMGTPAAVSVTHESGSADLTDALTGSDFHGAPGYEASFSPSRPGTWIFAMTPEPYWEPAEDAYILHYTKTYISAFDDDSGWQTTLGLKTEIQPLTRPYGIWAGNLFRGRVLRDGEPVPFAEVEVEHYAETPASAPSELMVTQTIVADADGVFSYAAPASGWWGFAALTTADYTLAHEGAAKPVELGAVIWVRFEAWDAE